MPIIIFLHSKTLQGTPLFIAASHHSLLSQVLQIYSYKPSRNFYMKFYNNQDLFFGYLLSLIFTFVAEHKLLNHATISSRTKDFRL